MIPRKMIPSNTIRVRATLIEPMLGTSPNNENIYVDRVASKYPMSEEQLAEELSTINAEEEVLRGMTVFHREADGVPFIFDYQILGFFKSAARALNKVKGTLSSKAKAYIKSIDQLIFIFPRRIRFDNVQPEDVNTLQRPLKAQTAQGERVALAMSETVPEGSSFTFEIKYLVEDDRDWIIELLQYGELNGLGCWRNASYGRFTFEIIE